jgi:hypothetical protein
MYVPANNELVSSPLILLSIWLPDSFRFRTLFVYCQKPIRFLLFGWWERGKPPPSRFGGNVGIHA